MPPRLSHIAAAAALVLLLLLPVADTVLAGDVPAPVILKGKGAACVADTDFMRRNHPELLEHQRGDTVRLGIRGAKFSLRGCVECHAVPGPDGRAISVAAPGQFCSACHEYAAVKIDCFECHASKPGATARLFRTKPR